MLKKAGAKIQSAWTLTKKTLFLASCWALVFAAATIGRLGVAFDYDDTLVFSKPAFDKAFGAVQVPYSPEFWAVVNQAYDLESPKIFACSIAWAFRLFGFKVSIITSRPGEAGDGLRKEWRRLASKREFIFAGGKEKIHEYLKDGNYLLYFADKDSGIAEARKANVFPVRIRRSPKSQYKEDYHPGTMGELMIPFSEY
jgi:acid phosphatase class B